MPNYANSLIYKLCCKDASITDEYIGSTTNKTKRKQHHKTSCNNENDKIYNFYVYQFIREHGGFENWDLIVLEEYSCENKTQLLMKERECIELRKPTLNLKNPFTSREEKKEQMKEYQQKNKDKINEINRRCYQKNKDKKKEYQQQNKDKIKQRKKEYYQQNEDKIKQQQKEYQQKNKDKINEINRRHIQQRKLKNKSAIIIQQFFKKYFSK